MVNHLRSGHEGSALGAGDGSRGQFINDATAHARRRASQQADSGRELLNSSAASANWPARGHSWPLLGPTIVPPWKGGPRPTGRSLPEYGFIDVLHPYQGGATSQLSSLHPSVFSNKWLNQRKIFFVRSATNVSVVKLVHKRIWSHNYENKLYGVIRSIFPSKCPKRSHDLT